MSPSLAVDPRLVQAPGECWEGRPVVVMPGWPALPRGLVVIGDLTFGGTITRYQEELTDA